MDPDEPRWIELGEAGGDIRPQLSALGCKAVIAKPGNELRPKFSDRMDSHSGIGRLARKAVARERRNYNIKGVARITAASRRIGQQRDDFDHFGKTARPAMRDDQRHRIGANAPLMNEMNAMTIKLCRELPRPRPPPLLPPPLPPPLPTPSPL